MPAPGYKDWGRCDLTYVELAEGTAVAGVFTRKTSAARPKSRWAANRCAGGKARALVVNAGNSNAFTGYRGREAVEQIMGQVAEHLGCEAGEVFVSSTGVIGVPLPLDKAREGVAAALAASPCTWEDAARTIGTTDTFPKGAAAQAIVDGKTVTLGRDHQGQRHDRARHGDDAGLHFHRCRGGAGVPAGNALRREPAQSFSCITVDSDTSTSDTVLAFATGKAGNAPLTGFDSPGADAFAAALETSAANLRISSCAMAKARRSSSRSKSPARSATRARGESGSRIANSPLVKTAIAGEDANWGRVVMAVGKAGEPADRDKLAIRFADKWVAQAGLAVDAYDEAPVAAHLKGRTSRIGVDIGLGEGRATVWTCDLTHGYISINADYRS